MFVVGPNGEAFEVAHVYPCRNEAHQQLMDEIHQEIQRLEDSLREMGIHPDQIPNQHKIYAPVFRAEIAPGIECNLPMQ